jgi:hypothetical protein
MSFQFKDAQFTYWNQDLQLTSKVYGIFFTTVSATYTAIGAGGSQTQTVTLRGLRPASGSGTPPAIEPGDFVSVEPIAALPTGDSIAATWISAANTLSIQLTSIPGNTPGAITFTVLIIKMGQNDGINS